MSLHVNDYQDILLQATPENYLGKGANGIVYKITYNNRIAALKIPFENKQSSLLNELVVYKHLCKIFDECYCQMNIVQMLGYNESIPFIILEYFDGADLTFYLNYPINSITYYTHRLMKRQYPNDANYQILEEYLFPLTNKEDVIFKMFSDIFEGISCLHYRRVLHKDLELKNILIRSDGKIGITDFGTSQIINLESYYYLISGFSLDLDKLGPMLGDFIDSKSNTPFQLLLEEIYPEEIDIRILLDTIASPKLQDLFLLFINFPSILSFISFIRYCNWNLDLDTTRKLIYESADIYNDNIQIDGPPDEYEKDLIMILDVDIQYVIDNIGEYINTYDLALLTLNYFRLIINSLMISINANPLSSDDSIYQGILNTFGNQTYPVIIKTFQELITDFGFLIKNFNLFKNAFMS